MKYQLLKFFCCCLVLVNGTFNAKALSDKDRLLLQKNFPFLYMLETPLKKLNPQPAVFITVRARLEHDALDAIKNCRSGACYSRTLQFTDAEITSVGNELVHLVLTEASIRRLIRTLKINGLYPVFKQEPDTAYVRKLWQTETRGIAYILNTYIGGQKPLYPKIDSISFDKDDLHFTTNVGVSVEKVLDNKFRTRPFFNVPLQLALKALLLNGRDEAVRYEPMYLGENKGALKLTKKVRWDYYPYSVIMVPGLGPELADVKLDPKGARRCDSAAVRYRERKAPFIVVSGGHVHPYKTPYCEAVEMKKYMVEKLRIPAAAIIIEPHARHTTTNLRNTNRLIFLYGIPKDKPVLIVTDAAQNNYINGGMKEKVIKELGYTPFTTIKKISGTETEYVPSAVSWQHNSLDPLDP